MSKKIIFESSHLSVISRESDSSEVVVAFNPLGLVVNGDNFWGEDFFRKHKISSIGIMTTTPNWYPRDDMIAAVNAINALCKGRRVVTYGHSQGGYGAIKYSRALNADIVLAFCPQWSIDPADVSSFDKRFHRYHKAHLLNGLKINEADIATNTYIFYDKRDKEDRLNISKIAERGAVNLFNVPFSGHSTIRVLVEAGTAHEMMMLIVRQTGDLRSDLRRIFRKSRKFSTTYCENKFKILESRGKVGFLKRMRSGAPQKIVQAVDMAVSYAEGRYAEFERIVIASEDVVLENFDIVQLWKKCREQKLTFAELRLSNYILKKRKNDCFMQLHVVNTFVNADMHEIASIALQNVINKFGVDKHAAHIQNFAKILGMKI